MKIGVLTFHKANNYGAVLQCYSLSTSIKKRFPGALVEVIDYCSKTMEDEYSKRLFIKTDSFLVRIKCLLKQLIMLPFGNKIESFNKKRNSAIREIDSLLPLSKNKLTSNDTAMFQGFVNSLNYDLVIVGSDAIWNDNQSFFPNPYFLSGIKCKKVSYAASAYGFKYKDNLSALKAEYLPSLRSFERIYVRDDETMNYIQSLSSELQLSHSCDPSLILNIEEFANESTLTSIKRKMVSCGIDLSKPMIGVMGSDWLAKEVKNRFGKQYQIICLYEWNKYCDFYLPNLTPIEWAVVFRFFKATFTHFFHGTLFSLKNYTLTFAVEKSNNYNSSYKTKIRDVLGRMGLLDRCYFRNETAEWQKISKIMSINENDLSLYKKTVKEALQKESLFSCPFFDYLDTLCADYARN